MPQRIGFVGLGIMGRPMARNLMDAGHGLILHNRTREKAETLATEGNARVADSLREVAESCAIVITMLPGPPDVERVIADGLIAHMERGALIADMSTSSPVLAKDLAQHAAERGIGMLDAPVSGGDVGAIEGTLSIMAGGSEEDFERARPLFEVMGDTVTHVGPAGTGQVVKAANQVVVALAIEAVSEALALGSKAGVAPAMILDVLSAGSANNRVMEVKRRNFLERDFEPGGKVEFHRKDLGIALAAARQYGVALPTTAMVDQMLGALETKGRGGWDHSALLSLVEELSGRKD